MSSTSTFPRSRLVDVSLGVVAASIGCLAVIAPIFRLPFLAALICAGAWLVLLPRGWLHGVDEVTKRIIVAFLLVRMVMPIAAERVTRDADAMGYHLAGVRVAADLQAHGFSMAHREVPGTGGVDLLLGYFYDAAGSPGRMVAYYLWSTVAAIATLLFWWATRSLVRDRQAQYAAFIFFMPTLLLWNASLGKEAPLTLATACLAAGLHVLTNRPVSIRGFAYLIGSVALAALIRPHVALLLVAAATAAIAVGSRRSAGGAIASRVLPFAASTAFLLALVPITQGILDPGGSTSLVEAAYERAEVTSSIGGGSGFETTAVRSVADVPLAVVTVLFRPFPWEVRTIPQAITSIEAVVIGSMFVMALWRIVRSPRRQAWVPVLVMAVVFVALFCVAFSSLGNFGLLARQRSQVLPFVVSVVFASMGPKRSGVSPADVDAPDRFDVRLIGN